MLGFNAAPIAAMLIDIGMMTCASSTSVVYVAGAYMLFTWYSRSNVPSIVGPKVQ